MSTSENILIRGVNWLGDAIMTLPAIRRLREAHPYAQLTLLTHEKLTERRGSRQHRPVGSSLTASIRARPEGGP